MHEPGSSDLIETVPGTLRDTIGSESWKRSQLSETTAAATSTSKRALHAEEAARTQAFAAVLAVLVGVALFFVPFQPVALWLNLLMAITLALVAGLCAWVWKQARDPARYDVRVFRVFTIGCALAALVIVYYGGVFSPAPVALVLGLSFFALGDDQRFVTIVAGALIGSYMILAIGVATDWLPQHSLIAAVGLSAQAEAFAVAVTSACFGVTVWHARLARRATRTSIEQLSVALAEIQQREALVKEAHLELDAAINLNAGVRGPRTGQTAGGYLLGELLGRGAMGEVYRGTLGQSEAVAVKILTERIGGRVASVDRFEREARIGARLSSANIVRVSAIGEMPDGHPFLVMELLDGKDLAWHLRRKRQFSPAEVVDLVYQVASGLEIAHEAGVVHRDIKPTNLFYDTSVVPSVWKILDFGVARDGSSQGTLTQGGVVGTPGYMAPEQAQGRVADRRSDVFALGAVAYRTLTGQPAFSASNAAATMYQVVHEQPPQPSRLVGAGMRRASAIDTVFAVALAKDATKRFESAAQFAEALEAASRGEATEKLRWRAATILSSAPWGQALA